VQYKNILTMIFNGIKCHVNTSLGLVGGCSPLCVRAWPPSVWEGFCAEPNYSKQFETSDS